MRETQAQIKDCESSLGGRYRILSQVADEIISVRYLVEELHSGQVRMIRKLYKRSGRPRHTMGYRSEAEPTFFYGLGHPCLQEPLEVFEDEKCYYLVTNVVEGTNLAQKLSEEGPQSWENAVKWGLELCDVLACLHGHQPPIIHLDLYSGDVIIGPDGSVASLNMNPVRWTKDSSFDFDGCILGCICDPPEMIGSCGWFDVRSDIYGLGAILFWIVTGKRAFSPDVNYSVLPIRSICPWLPKKGREGVCVRGLEQVILTCTQPNPANRYQSVEELTFALHEENLSKLGGLRARIQRRLHSRRNK